MFFVDLTSNSITTEAISSRWGQTVAHWLLSTPTSSDSAHLRYAASLLPAYDRMFGSEGCLINLDPYRGRVIVMSWENSSWSNLSRSSHTAASASSCEHHGENVSLPFRPGLYLPMEFRVVIPILPNKDQLISRQKGAKICHRHRCFHICSPFAGGFDIYSFCRQ